MVQSKNYQVSEGRSIKIQGQMIDQKMLATCGKPVVNILKRQETFSIV